MYAGLDFRTTGNTRGKWVIEGSIAMRIEGGGGGDDVCRSLRKMRYNAKESCAVVKSSTLASKSFCEAEEPILVIELQR